MKFAIHQPQYLPWLGYFDKIARCDHFIFLDDVQYKKREFQNRNKIKTPNGPQWLTIPVKTKGQYFQKISDTYNNTEDSWEHDHWKSIEHNYNHAPFFNEHRDFFATLYSKKWDRLMDVSMDIITYVNGYLGITTPCTMSSSYDVTSLSSQRIIDLARAIGADTYLSGSGGKAYMDENLFSQNNVAIEYQHYTHPQYQQLHGAFEPYLCIIDLLFNCGHDSRAVLLNEK